MKKAKRKDTESKGNDGNAGEWSDDNIGPDGEETIHCVNGVCTIRGGLRSVPET